jgi:hypothetical protein
MGRNPRPCVCGHRRDDHRRPHDGLLPCWYGQIDFIDFGCQCPNYRPARRTEPLRARRPWRNPPLIHRFFDYSVSGTGANSDAILRHVRQEDTASGARS